MEEVHFSDENLTYDRARAIDLFNKLKKLNISWTAPNGIMVASLDKHVIKLMAESGCFSVSLAIESGSQRVLKEIIQKPLQLHKTFPVVRELKTNRIHTRAFFLIGLPGETRKEIWKTILLSHYLELDQNEIMIALPYPGTRLFDRCMTEKLFSENFDVQNLHNDSGPITTDQFNPDFLYLVKEVDRFIFHLKRKNLKLTSLIISLIQKHKLRFFKIFIHIIFFKIKLTYIKLFPGEKYFSI